MKAMPFTPEQIDILFDAVEGYAPLWDAKWECSRCQSNLPESEWISQAQALVTDLIQHDLISLTWESGGNTVCAISPKSALELLKQAEYWFPPIVEGNLSICFSATEKGKQLFRTSEEIRNYYVSPGFSLRYPPPEWHPMKQI